jgi:hypothetical protein
MRKKSFARSSLPEIFPFYKMEDLYPSPLEIGKEAPKAPHNYEHCSLTIFDHWLSEKEYEEKMITFNTFNNTPSRPSKLWNTYKRYEEKFHTFFKKLYEHGIYMLLNDKDLVIFNSKNEYMRYCLYNIREQKSHSFFVPSLGIIITGGWNLTMHVLHNKDWNKEKFESLAKQAGLFIL